MLEPIDGVDFPELDNPQPVRGLAGQQESTRLTNPFVTKGAKIATHFFIKKTILTQRGQNRLFGDRTLLGVELVVGKKMADPMRIGNRGGVNSNRLEGL